MSYPYNAGQIVQFSATFTLDAVPRLPASVTLRIRSTKSGVVAVDDHPMVLTDGTRFVYLLDTTGYDEGNHAWTVYTDDVSRAIRGGEFAIIRNQSNPF